MSAVAATCPVYHYPLPKWPERDVYVAPFGGSSLKEIAQTLKAMQPMDLNALVEKVLVEYGNFIYTNCHGDVFRLLQPENRFQRGIVWSLVEFARVHRVQFDRDQQAKRKEYFAKLEGLREQVLVDPMLQHLGDSYYRLQAIRAEEGMDYEVRRRLMDIIALVDRAKREAEEAANRADDVPRDRGAGSRTQSARRRARSADDRARTQRTKGDTAAKPLHPHAK